MQHNGTGPGQDMLCAILKRKQKQGGRREIPRSCKGSERYWGGKVSTQQTATERGARRERPGLGLEEKPGCEVQREEEEHSGNSRV